MFAVVRGVQVLDFACAALTWTIGPSFLGLVDNSVAVPSTLSFYLTHPHLLTLPEQLQQLWVLQNNQERNEVQPNCTYRRQELRNKASQLQALPYPSTTHSTRIMDRSLDDIINERPVRGQLLHSILASH